MPDDAAFLAAIREQPLDDLRRLVYADWLDEHARPAEAEYLRLVAALAEPGTPVDATHPHAVRLLTVAEGIDHSWREAAGGRFDLWFDGYGCTQKIPFIKLVREMTGMGLADAKTFSETLPKVLTAGMTFEELAGQAVAFRSTEARSRILSATEVPSRGLLRGDIVLQWRVSEGLADPGRAEQSRQGLATLRSILARTPDSVTSPREVPETTEECKWAVLVATGQPASQFARWREQLIGGYNLLGHTADPPFTGWISVFIERH